MLVAVESQFKILWLAVARCLFLNQLVVRSLYAQVYITTVYASPAAYFCDTLSVQSSELPPIAAIS